ncbi:receptor expression-enhancing protein 5-like [Melanaphis sacchari]|uniref:receptor expression-enhancing protein 5-like n=1 Tax=Melanaphis sacchari TaxID=742174 RepID=UPI000DC15092|nr:receptor expression-enhancing protein 5-like [Melanaphis sacchari]
MAKTIKMETVMDAINDALYDRSKPWDAAFGKAEALTGWSRFKVLMCILLVNSVLLVYGANAKVTSNIIGLVYPALTTLSLTVSSSLVWRKYDRVSTADQARNEKFTYWMTFTAVLIAESLCRPVVRLIPLYRTCRTWFLVWCFAPIRHNGSGYIFDMVVRPCFKCGVTLRPLSRE